VERGVCVVSEPPHAPIGFGKLNFPIFLERVAAKRAGLFIPKGFFFSVLRVPGFSFPEKFSIFKDSKVFHDKIKVKSAPTVERMSKKPKKRFFARLYWKDEFILFIR
jgi:hypothetical protein